MTRPGRRDILALAKARAATTERATYHFTPSGLLTFAAAVLELAPPGVDAARLDALAEAAGFMRGTDAGAPAFRLFGTDDWHPDLRTAIDESLRAKARAAKEDL